VHPAGAVLDEYQDMQPLQQHGIHVKEIDREDPGGLGVQELPPGRARAARRRSDARDSQDLIDGGWRDPDAELGRLAVDPPVSCRCRKPVPPGQMLRWSLAVQPRGDCAGMG
jgi:hypothetical protein